MEVLCINHFSTLVMRHGFGNLQLCESYRFLVSLVDNVMRVNTVLKYSITQYQVHSVTHRL